MMTLALDVDGVLLDPARNGAGPWTNELTARFGIEASQMRDAFFAESWDDIVTGRLPIEDGLAVALEQIGAEVDVDSVLSCWFDADYTPLATAFDLAHDAARAGHRIVLATNQEHRRAEYLRGRIGATIPLEHVFYSADIGFPKHDRRFFETASERLDLAAAERASVVFVDDVVDNVEVARSAGWSAVHATPDRPWCSDVQQLLGLGQ